MQAIISLALRSSRKYPYSHLSTEGNGNSEGRGVQIPDGWGAASRIGSSSFFPGAQSKIDDQAISVILQLIGVVKQKLLFSLMIFYLLSTECFFQDLHDSLCNMICVSS